MDNAYIYTRVSTVIQVDGFSLDAQEEEIKTFAKVRGINIVGKYSDEGKSGKNAEHTGIFANDERYTNQKGQRKICSCIQTVPFCTKHKRYSQVFAGIVKLRCRTYRGKGRYRHIDDNRKNDSKYYGCGCRDGTGKYP